MTHLPMIRREAFRLMSSTTTKSRGKIVFSKAIGLQARLDAIEALCRRYSSPSSEPGTHSLAFKIIKIIEDKTP